VTFLTILYGAFLSRFHGGGFKGGVNKFLKNTLWALPFALCTAFAILPYVDYTTLGILTALSLLLCIGGKGTGHGGFMDLSRTTKNDNDERLEFLIKPLQGKISEYWYDFIGLALVGFAAVSGAVFTVVYFNPLVAAIIAIGGMLKSVAYAIGWTIYPKGNGKGIKNFDEATAIGEFLTGAFAFAGLGIVFNMLGVW
jgi:hypothetical protein